MDPFFQELKQAREAKRLTLSDIADATLINVKYLEQIEQGNTDILPQTYVRAFIREYAATIGLNPDQVMAKYDEFRAGAALPPEQTPAAAPARTTETTNGSPATLRWVFLAVGVIGAIIILWASLSREQPVPVQEIPFQSSLSENEKRLAPAPVQQTIPQQVRPAAAVPTDSITLRATVTDTVWMQVQVDDNPPHEYIFRPNAKMGWKASDRFTLTLGNGGAVQFTLDQKKLGALGKPGSVLRSVVLSRETLKQQ